MVRVTTSCAPGVGTASSTISKSDRSGAPDGRRRNTTERRTASADMAISSIAATGPLCPIPRRSTNQRKARASPLDPTKGRCPLDPRQGRSPWNPLLWFGDGRDGGAVAIALACAGAMATAPPSLPSPNQNGWIAKALPLLGVQGAKPPGGFQGGALTFLPSPDCPAGAR